jgi:hypothetical protein
VYPEARTRRSSSRYCKRERRLDPGPSFLKTGPTWLQDHRVKLHLVRVAPSKQEQGLSSPSPASALTALVSALTALVSALTAPVSTLTALVSALTALVSAPSSFTRERCTN